MLMIGRHFISVAFEWDVDFSTLYLNKFPKKIDVSKQAQGDIIRPKNVNYLFKRWHSQIKFTLQLHKTPNINEGNDKATYSLGNINQTFVSILSTITYIHMDGD